MIDLPDDASATVLGAPGSGRTTAITELVADRVERRGWSPDSILVLTPSRVSATRLRDRIALRLARATDGPRVRTAPSLAFEVVTAAARRAGSEPPRLLTGGDQDLDLAALLDGHLESGTGPEWPEPLGPQVRRLRVFRTELRELLARAVERDVTPARLAELGRATDRPQWVAAAELLAEYLDVVASARPAQFDAAELVRFAEHAIRTGEAGERVDALRLVAVDDAQDSTESALLILQALASRGIPVIAAGDPDATVTSFRGGSSDALATLAARLAIPAERRLVLPLVHRGGPAIRSVVTAVTGRIGAAGGGRQRAARAERPDAVLPDGSAAVTTLTAASPAREATAIARLLREEHLLRTVPWSRLAVVVRSGSRVPELARALAAAEVPTHAVSAGLALREDRAARALLLVVEAGVGRIDLTPAVAADLLLGPFGGLDPLGLRRLRRALRAEELTGGGDRLGGELLADALGSPARLATIDSPGARAARRLAGILDRVRGSGDSIEDLLWIVWDGSGLAEAWRSRALSAGLGAVEANRDLDGVLALFTAAKRFAERRPDVPAAEFLAEVLDAEVPEDTLSPRGTEESVLVCTPAATLGREFTTVVVAGLQEGVWPDLRPRGGLLAPQALALALDGVDADVDERRLVLDDELRMFALAVSRADERLVLTAVENDDEAAGPLLRLARGTQPGEEGGGADGAGADGEGEQATDPAASASPRDTPAPLPLSLRGTIGHLRRLTTTPFASAALRDDAIATLATLADQGLPGADPGDWLGLIAPSSTAPLHAGEPVPVSPSSIERLEDSPLDWFLERIAGGDPGVSASVGTLVHWAMETVEDPTVDAIEAALDARWPELVFEAPWLADRNRRLATILARGLAEYLADSRAAGIRLIGAEDRFTLPLDGIEVRGSIDRLELGADGEVSIVDLKTGAPITAAARIAAHPQLEAYQLAYAAGVFDEALDPHGEHRSGGAKLLYVREGVRGRGYREAIQAPLDGDGLERVRDRIRSAAALIAADGFDGVAELGRWGLGDLARLRLLRVGEVSGD